MPADGAAGDGPVGLNVAGLSGSGEDGCGRVYVTSINGPVYRVASTRACAGPAPVPFPTPPGMPGTLDTIAPVLTARRAARQRVLRRGAVLVRVGCDEACTVRVTGRIQFRQRGRLVRLPLRPAAAQLAGGTAGTLRLRVPPTARPAVRRALALGRQVIVTMTARAQDATGNVRFAKIGTRAVP